MSETGPDLDVGATGRSLGAAAPNIAYARPRDLPVAPPPR